MEVLGQDVRSRVDTCEYCARLTETDREMIRSAYTRASAHIMNTHKLIAIFDSPLWLKCYHFPQEYGGLLGVTVFSEAALHGGSPVSHGDSCYSVVCSLSTHGLRQYLSR